MGRISYYTDETLDKVRHYMVSFDKEGDVIPSVAGLASYLGVGRQTLYDWRKEEGKEEFAALLEDILSKQERVLLNGGLKGELNPTIAKLALAKHGYHDKVDNTMSGGDRPLETKHTVEFVNADKDA